MCTSSRRRARQGRTPIYGTAWMVPPSYHQSQHDYNNQAYGGPAPAPPYGGNGREGNMDNAYAGGHGEDPNSGYYDSNGNWVAHSDNVAPGGGGAPQGTNYGPPPGPPPNYGGNTNPQGNSPGFDNSYEMANMPAQPPSAAYKR